MGHQNTAKIVTETGSVALVIQSIKRQDDKLVIDGKALGTMNMDMILTLEEFFNVIKMALSWSVVSFILLVPYLSIKHSLARKNK